MKTFLDSGSVCAGVHSNALHGFSLLKSVDSLQVRNDSVPEPVMRPTMSSHTASTPAVMDASLWRYVSVAALRARERGCNR